MSKTDNSKTLNNLININAEEVDTTTSKISTTLTIPVVFVYPTVNGTYNGQIEYYQSTLFVWDSAQSEWINIPSISFSTNPPANPIQGQRYYNTAGNSLCVWNGGVWKSSHFT